MVELWMSEVDDAMKDALIYLTFTAMQEWTYDLNMSYLQKYPGQCILCSAFINWTKSVTDIIEAEVKLSVIILQNSFL